MTLDELYAVRASRVARLAEGQVHAAEILGLYGEVLQRQEPLYRRALSSDWPERGGAEPPPLPSLGLAGLPFAKLDRPFRRFIADVTTVATAPLAAAGQSLTKAPGEGRKELLRRTVEQDGLGELVASLRSEVPHLVFFSRAFLQPLAEGLAARKPTELPGVPAGTCPRCGWPPQVAAVQDEPETKGRRRLVCGLCATAWPYPRIRCANCGEEDPEKLLLHESESLPHLRVEECTSCRGYLKSVDLRRDGHAVPVVDDIASPELDLWAEDRGLWKLCRNLMGL